MLDPRPPDVQALFSGAAHTYDFLNHLFSLQADRRWRAALVRAARLRPGRRVLDVCTGTADVAIALARRLRRLEGGGPAAGGRVVGIDFSERMLERGRRKVRRRGLEDRIALAQADALRLPFAGGSFDLVSIAFGLRNLADRRLGIREMARVLRPGGRLLVLEFSPPPPGWTGRMYAWYLGRWMPMVGGLVSGSAAAYRYLHSSIAAFPRPPQVAALLEEAGLQRVSWRRLSGGIACLHRGIRRA